MSEAESRQTSLAFAELINSVSSMPLFQAISTDGSCAQTTVSGSEIEQVHQINLIAFTNWVKPTGEGLAAIAPCELAKLAILLQELRQSNLQLSQREAVLEQELAECQKALQVYKKRSDVAESMLSQQTQELTAAQNQVMRLVNKLEASEQNVQEQQSVVATLTNQLKISQEQVVHLEQENSRVQTKYQEKSQQLLQTETTCRELRTRLTRQQRHSLQLKVALEKSLEIPIPNYQTPFNSSTNPHTTTTQPQGSTLEYLSFLMPQPIAPWSAKAQSFSPQVQSTPTLIDNETYESAINTDELNSSSSLQETILLPNISQETPVEADNQENIKPFNPSPETNSDCEQHQWENLLDLLQAVEEQLTFSPQTGDHFLAVSELEELLNQADSLSPELTAKSVPQTTNCTSNSNCWPSPVIYPSRPPKARKSLAAIELPTFSQKIAQQTVAETSHT